MLGVHKNAINLLTGWGIVTYAEELRWISWYDVHTKFRINRLTGFKFVIQGHINTGVDIWGIDRYIHIYIKTETSVTTQIFCLSFSAAQILECSFQKQVSFLYFSSIWKAVFANCHVRAEIQMTPRNLQLQRTAVCQQWLEGKNPITLSYIIPDNGHQMSPSVQ